jgi:hypothetical protein
MAFTKISSTRLKSEVNRINISANQSSVDLEASRQQMIRLAKEFAPTQEEIGAINAGFASLTESVKPALEAYAKRAEEVAKTIKKDPAISEMTSNVPNITVNKSPATKANVDTLVGATTSASKKLNKVISAGSPTAIKKSLEDAPGLDATADKITAAVKEAQDVINNPVIQQKFADLGIPEEEVNALTSQLSTSLDKFVEEDGPTIMSNALSDMSSRVDRQMGNPIGSTSSPFGSIGLDFGNILGSLTGLSTGTGPFKELGQELETIAGSIDPLTGESVPILIDNAGNTSINKVIDKGLKTAVSEPTTPIFTIGNSDTPQSASDFQYNPVNDKKEFEIEIKNATRELDHVIVNWSLSHSNEFFSAKEFNETHLKNILNNFSDFVNNAIQTHYFIQKDGLVIRILPIETKPLAFTSVLGAKQKIYDKAIVVQFDAGYVHPIGSANTGNFSEKSITPEQWKSFDMIMDVLYRFMPGGTFIGQDALHADQIDNYGVNGPGFDVDTYMNKKREMIDVK